LQISQHQALPEEPFQLSSLLYCMVNNKHAEHTL